MCINSDKGTLKTMQSSTFLEYGTIQQGKMVYLQVSKAPLFDKKDNLIGITGSARNVTKEIELKRTKQLSYIL